LCLRLIVSLFHLFFLIVVLMKIVVTKSRVSYIRLGFLQFPSMPLSWA
jgi:hypothetical protein